MSPHRGSGGASVHESSVLLVSLRRFRGEVDETEAAAAAAGSTEAMGELW